MGLLAADAGGVAFELPTLGDECCELQQGGGSGRVEGGAEYQLLVHGRQSVRKRDACGQTKFNGISKKGGLGGYSGKAVGTADSAGNVRDA